MIPFTVFVLVVALLAAFAVAGWQAIGPCDHFEDRDERWEW